MPTYRIVVVTAPPSSRAILFLDLEEDEAALKAAVEALYPSETALVWEADRLVGRVEAPGEAPDAETRTRPLLQKLQALICSRLGLCANSASRAPN